MRNMTITGLAAASLMLAACQSDSYKVSGTADWLSNGDTIILAKADETAMPIDTTVVNEGRFGFEGLADTARLAMIYCTKAKENRLPLFLEPGRIKVDFTGNALTDKVGGTSNNNKWQDFMDATVGIGLDINTLAARLYDTKANHEARQQLLDSINNLNQAFGKIVTDYATKNIGNEFGFFIITYYTAFIHQTDLRQLIDKMPEDMRNRQEVKRLYDGTDKKKTPLKQQ